MTLEELTDIFRQLGAPKPESWAGSQLREGIPQLARYIFLMQAWNCVVADGDDRWIEECLQPNKAEPGGGGAIALQNLLRAGVDRQDLSELVRTMQWRTLCGISYLLENPSVFSDGVPLVEWGLFQLNEEGQPMEHIGGLHESVLETEPSGREMRALAVDIT